MIKHLILISLILGSCQNPSQRQFYNINSINELEKYFKSSQEYAVYKQSSDSFLMILTTYKIQKHDITYTCKNNGEALAFEKFIKNKTNLKIKLVENKVIK